MSTSDGYVLGHFYFQGPGSSLQWLVTMLLSGEGVVPLPYAPSPLVHVKQ